jgi:hypothetical protein
MSRSNVIGFSSVEAIGALLSLHPEIAELTLFEPTPVSIAQDRLRNDSETQSIIDVGLEIRAKLGLPFWDAVLAATFGRGRPGFPVLEQALFHNSSPHRRVRVQSSRWSASHVGPILIDASRNRMVVLSSLVRLENGERKHIPFVDFHCPVSAANEDLCGHAASLLDPDGGYLLESGESYHFYGKSLLSEVNLYVFLGRVLLLCPIADRAWVAHQLIEGACGLRISAKANGGPVPRVVREIIGTIF